MFRGLVRRRRDLDGEHVSRATYAQVLVSSMDARVTSGLLGGNGFGNIGGGPVLGPGQFNFDESLSKLIKIGEK